MESRTEEFMGGQLQIIHNGKICKSIVGTIPLKEGVDFIIDRAGGVVIKGTGFDKINAISGVSFIKPETILVDGVKKENPYRYYDHEYNLKGIILSLIGVGFSKSGQLVVNEFQLRYDLIDVLIHDISTKVELSFPSEGSVCENLLAFYTTSPEGLELYHSCFMVKDNLFIVLNLKNLEAVKIIEEHNLRKRSIDLIVATDCRKAILRSHPASAIDNMKIVGTQGNMIAWVSVHGWKEDVDVKDLYSAIEEAKCQSKEYISSSALYLEEVSEDKKDTKEDHINNFNEDEKYDESWPIPEKDISFDDTLPF